MISRFCAALAVAFFANALAADVVPLGVVYKDESVSPKLSFTNRGKSDVTLGEPTISCECLQRWFSAQTVTPGTTVSLPFTYVSHRTGRIDVRVEFRDATKAVLQTTIVKGFVADPSWVLSPAELAEDHEATVVDVRDASRYAQAHLPRAINVLPFAIKARTDLRERKVVLVDDGFAPVDLLEHVAALRALGFKNVTMLAGGVPAWIRAGRPVVGATHSALGLVTISASDFVRATAAAKWRVIQVGAMGRPLADATLAKDWSDAAALAVGSTTSGPDLRQNVLVVAPDVATYARIEGRIGGEGRSTVYYLAGGQPALERFRATETAVALGPQVIQVQPPTHSHSAASSCNCGGK